jgi:hypothetical protein
MAFERRHRIKAMERVQARLEKLERRIAKGKLKALEKELAQAQYRTSPRRACRRTTF